MLNLLRLLQRTLWNFSAWNPAYATGLARWSRQVSRVPTAEAAGDMVLSAKL